MPNKNYVTSYLFSLEGSPEIAIQTYELTEKRVKSSDKTKGRIVNTISYYARK